MNYPDDLSVLVVDDNESMRELLVSLLASYRVSQIETAKNGEEALGRLRERTFNLIITDYEMEPVNGLTLIRNVRKGGGCVSPDTPFLMVTAHANRDRIRKASDLGVVHCLAKPISRGALLERLDHMFRPPQVDQNPHDKTPAKALNKIMDKLSKEYFAKANGDIDEIFSAYETAMKKPDQCPTMVRKIAKIAHDMKGQGGSFGYPLMTKIAASLGEFCLRAPNPRAMQMEVVTAHVDAMRAVMAEDMRGDGGETGRTLLSMLEVASLKHASEARA